MNMKRYRPVAILLAVAGLMAASGVVSSQTPPSNTTRHTSSADVVPQAGPLEVVQSIIDFVPGAASTVHYHSGTVHNTVLTGEITVRYANREQRVGTGQDWTDAPGTVHQAVNLGSTPATVAASYVQPKGAMVTVPVASLQSPGPSLPPAPPNAGDGFRRQEIALGRLSHHEAFDGPALVAVQQFTFDPGARAGWHTHPGPATIVVTKGEMAFYDGDGCRTVYPAGSAVIEQPGQVHEPRNETTELLEFYVTFIVPVGPALRSPAEAPTAECGR